ncbi:MAG: immunoglobulin domain-containing protein [Candidatus Kapabacteria bacterium]|nr:immunoglobulin domain-containing protein [Ignavibacteriota bacterium]MCW5884549.1 immunoglobulin domain-containing protein [Candidatus Kapabacteria bacterium]
MRIFTKSLAILAVMFFSLNVYGQVEIEGTNYARLSLAFNAINAGTHTGDIEVLITDDFTETTTAVLNASGEGSADYESVIIYPTDEYTIQGNLTNGIIQLSGADNVTIDGRANLSGSSIDLTIQNNATSGAVIRIDRLVSGSGNPAENNTVRYCNIRHSGKTGSRYGITFGTSTSYTGTASHEGNRVEYCNFSNMYYGIRSYSSSADKAESLIINNNYFGSSTLTESLGYMTLYLYYVNDAKVYENTFEYLNHTGTMYVMYVYYCDDVEIFDNSIKNIDHPSSIYILRKQSSPNAKVYGNTVENVKANSTFYGFYTSSSSSTEFTDNVFKNIINNGTFYSFYLSSCGTSKINNNSIEDVQTSNGTLYNLYMSSCASSEVIGNYVDGATATTYLYNVYATSCASTKFHNNNFNDLNSVGGSTTSAHGFYILSSNSSEFINNSISNVRTTQVTTSTLYNPFGIFINSGTGYKIWYNSVYLTGKQHEVNTSSSMSACLMIYNSSTNSLDIRNNNFYNELEGRPGSKMYSIYMTSTNNRNSSTIDYNNYYVAGQHGVLGYLAGDRTTLSAWQSISQQDVNSISIDPDFNSSSVLAPFLNSAVLGKGTPINTVSTDIMGESRSSTAPTIGAYETADDIVGPQIDYEPLLTTTSTNNRTLVATITDRTGVDVGASSPRLYYRTTSTNNTFNSNSSTTSGWKYSEAESIVGNQFTFTLDYGKLNDGADVGDEIEYFLIAKDVSSRENVSYSSGKFTSEPTTTNLNSDNFPVTGAESYRLALGFSGNYTIGSNQTYTSLTKPEGIFKALMDNVVDGDVFLNISSNLNETGEIQLGSLTYAPNGPYKIYIRPNSDTKRTISGEIGGALIRLIGVNNVEIDGSYDGEGRYLKFENTATNSTTTYRATIMVGSNSGQGGNDITIKNCEITSGNRLNYSFGIITSDGAITTSTSSPGITNLLIKNNHIYNSTYGIYAAGQTAIGTTTLNNLIIEDNLVGDDDANNSILSYGIEVRYAPYAQIRRNKIWNFNGGSNNTNYVIGIRIYSTGNVPTYIDGNDIYGMNYQGTSICFANGIWIATGNYNEITNNKIADILTTNYTYTSPTSYQAAGIRVQGSFTKILHNTIIMQGQMKYYSNSTNYGGFAANIFFTSSYSGNDVRGNILHNSVTKASNATWHPQAYCIWYYTTANIGPYFTLLDHNVYSVGNGAKIGGNGTTTIPHPYQMFTLNQWQSYTNKDWNSKTGMPEFVDTKEDLHINGSSIGNSFYMYGGIPEITYDGDGEMRNATTYYGADEVNAIFELAEDTKIAPSNAVHCVEDVVTISANPDVTGFGDGVERSGLSAIDINWYKNGELISGAKSKNLTFNPVKMSDSARYFATGTFMGKTVTSTETLLKVETPMSISYQPPTSDVCTTSPELTLLAEATGTILGYQWEFMKKGTMNWVDVQGATSNVLELVITNDLVGDYRLRVMGPGNCGPATIWTQPAMVTISEPLHSVNLHQIEKSEGKNLYYTCVDEDITLSVTDEGTVFGYVWQKDAGNGFVDLSLAQYPTARNPVLRINGSTPAESGIYRCLVLGSASCGTAEVLSQEVDIRIWPYFSLDQQPESKTLCEGENSFIRINISGIVYSYQWFKDGVMLTSEDSPYYDKPVFYLTDSKFEDGGVYQCRVQAEDCFGFLDFMSEEASIYVSTGTEITVPPMTQAVVPGSDVTFRVRAHVNGTPEGYVPEIQWYKGNQPLVEGGRFIGTKSDRLSIANVQDSDFGENYRVIVTGHCGSDEASFFGLIKGEVIITQQPVGADACEDDMIILSVSAETSVPGGFVTYQWYKEGIAIMDGDGIMGSQSAELMIAPAKPNNSGNYHVEVKPGNSDIGILSDEVSVTIDPKPKFTSQPDANVTIETGGVLALTVEVEGIELEYQWYFDGTAIEGEDTNTLMIYDVTEDNTGNYWVEVTNRCGTVQSVISEVIVTSGASTVTEVSENGFILGNAVPNPVNATANLEFIVPAESQVKITLVNDLGAEIAVLTDATLSSGTHNLSINTESLNLTSGVYSVVLKSSGTMLTQRIVVVR